MADISMCKNTECPKHLQCYRFTAPESLHWQSYADFKWDDGCDHFWDNWVEVGKEEKA